MMKRFFSLLFAAFVMFASVASAQTKKTLVLYYSQSGATKTVATEIQSQLGADIAAIEAVKPYDGDFQQTIARFQQEKQAGETVAIRPLSVDVTKYDIIFLGFPVWGGTYASPIATLVSENDFAGKTIVPFCTFGSGGLTSSTKDLKKALPNAKVADGYGCRNARISAAGEEVNRFLIEGEYKSGSIKRLITFPEHHEVKPAEVAIFNQACGDYQFPLGTPVDVSSRRTPTGTEYEYTVDNRGQYCTIYVIVPNDKDAKPEFTQVVRWDV